MSSDEELVAKKNALIEAVHLSELHFNKAYKFYERWNIMLTVSSVSLTLLATAFGSFGDSKIISDQTKSILTALFGGSAVAIQSLMGTERFPVRERARANRKLRNRVRTLKNYKVKTIQNFDEFNKVQAEYETILQDEISIDE